MNIELLNKANKEITELKAQINALSKGYEEAIECIESEEWGEDSCEEERKILSLIPQQCLAMSNQQAIRDAISNSEQIELAGQGYVGTYVSLEDLEVNILQLGDNDK